MEAVRAALQGDVRSEGSAEEGQVADRVERLVAHRLVGEPKWAQRPVISEDDSMLQRRAPNEPSGPQRLRLAQQAERAGGRQLVVVVRAAYPTLPPDGVVSEVDRHVEALLA